MIACELATKVGCSVQSTQQVLPLAASKEIKILFIFIQNEILSINNVLNIECIGQTFT
jgi:hypothetical protein